jgi:hypothetical protein
MEMKKLLLATIALVALTSAVHAGDASEFLLTLNCDQLWFGRNTVFKERGYCFKTPRAISVFGNAGCRYDDEYAVPLSVPDRNLIAAIRQAERQLHCSL